MHVEYTMHKSNNFSFTNMVYYRMYKQSRPFGMLFNTCVEMHDCIHMGQVRITSANKTGCTKM